MRIQWNIDWNGITNPWKEQTRKIREGWEKQGLIPAGWEPEQSEEDSSTMICVRLFHPLWFGLSIHPRGISKGKFKAPHIYYHSKKRALKMPSHLMFDRWSLYFFWGRLSMALQRRNTALVPDRGPTY